MQPAEQGHLRRGLARHLFSTPPDGPSNTPALTPISTPSDGLPSAPTDEGEHGSTQPPTTVGSNAPLPVGGRKKVKERVGLAGDDVYCFHPHQPAYKKMTEIVRGFYKGDWPNCSKVPKTVTDVWFGQFQNQFDWDVPNVQMQKAFIHLARKHIRDTFKGHRDRKTVPSFIAEDQWARMERIRLTDVNMVKQAEINKKNKASQKAIDAGVFRRGSRKMTRWMEVLEEKEGKRPEISQVVRLLFSKKDGTWSGTRPATIVDNYEKLDADQSQTDPIDEDMDDDIERVNKKRAIENELWIKACDGSKYGRIFALGEEGTAIIHNGKVRPSLSQGQSSQAYQEAQVQPLREEIKELQSTVRDLVKNQQEFQSTIIQLIQRRQVPPSTSSPTN